MYKQLCNEWIYSRENPSDFQSAVQGEYRCLLFIFVVHESSWKCFIGNTESAKCRWGHRCGSWNRTFGALCVFLKHQVVKAGNWWFGHALEDIRGHAQTRNVFNWTCATCSSEYMGLYITFREEQQSRSTRKRTKDTNSSRWLFSWHTNLSRFEGKTWFSNKNNS